MKTSALTRAVEGGCPTVHTEGEMQSVRRLQRVLLVNTRGEPGEVERGRTETRPFLGSNNIHMNLSQWGYRDICKSTYLQSARRGTGWQPDQL